MELKTAGWIALFFYFVLCAVYGTATLVFLSTLGELLIYISVVIILSAVGALVLLILWIVEMIDARRDAKLALVAGGGENVV